MMSRILLPAALLAVSLATACATTPSHPTQPSKSKCATRPQDVQATKASRLFVIERPDHPKEVVYDARFEEGCFNETDPIRIYWVSKGRGEKLRDLSTLEKMAAYGIKIISAQKDRVVFTLKALKEREIQVVVDPDTGTPRAVTTIEGENCYLESVSVNAREHALNPVPEVLSVDIRGRSVRTNKPVSETLSHTR